MKRSAAGFTLLEVLAALVALGAAALDIACWRPSPGGGAWEPAWSAPGLPALVRLRIGFPPRHVRDASRQSRSLDARGKRPA